MRLDVMLELQEGLNYAQILAVVASRDPRIAGDVPPGRQPRQGGGARRALDAACEAVGRDPASASYSLMTGCLAGATEADLADRARRLQQASGNTADTGAFLDNLADTWIVGTPDRMLEQLRALADAGVERVMLQHNPADDVEMLDVVAELVTPHLPSGPRS